MTVDWMSVGSMAVVATVVAKGLDYFGYIGRRSAEREEALNEMTFLLLEVRHILRLLSSSRIKLAVNEWLGHFETELGIGKMPEEVKGQVSQYIENSIYGIAFQKVRQSYEQLKSAYLPAAQRVAKFRPILAYRLNGREQILVVFELLDKHISEWNEKFSEPSEEMKAQFAAQTKGLALEDLVLEIEEEILEVARAAGLLPWMRAKKFLGLNASEEVANSEMAKRLIQGMVQVLREMGQVPPKANGYP